MNHPKDRLDVGAKYVEGYGYVDIKAFEAIQSAERKLLQEAMQFVKSMTEALPADKDTVKTCYAICNHHRDMAHELLIKLTERLGE